MPKTPEILIIALGGNALNSPEGKGDYLEQSRNARKAAREIVRVAKKKYKVVITHGNGPQVGNILLQQEAAKEEVAPMPLAICGAESQGQIGTILTTALNNELKKTKTKAVSLITHVLVARTDRAFQNPQKPIGPIYTPKEAKKLEKGGQVLKEVKIGAFRRVVASPLPLEILEIGAIRGLLEKNLIPVVVGGGGIPVAKTGDKLYPIDAVIDKDLASAVLALELKAKHLIILTNIRRVALNYQKSNQKWLDTISLTEAEKYLKEGYFPPGSMGPKIQAAIKFLRGGGKKVTIGHLQDLKLALGGKAGTIIIK